MQKHNLTGRTIKIKLRWPDFTTLTRQLTLSQPTDEGEVIAKAALSLFEQNWAIGKPVRLLGVGVSGLEKPAKQIGLWDRNWEKEYRLRDVIHDIQARFGEDILAQGVAVDEQENQFEHGEESP